MSGADPITTPSQDELRALWESGIPLDDAWLEFTPDNFDGIMLRALRTHPDDDVMFERAHDERVRQRYQEMRGWLPRTYEARQIKLRNKIQVQRSYLLDNLYADELWAIGFRTLGSGFDELARVPRQFFFTDYEQERDVCPDVYWTKGELKAGSEAYFDIRVVRPPQTEAESERTIRSFGASEKQQAAKAPAGRPNTRDQVRELVEKLWEAEPEFRALPHRTAQAREVRARLVGEEARPVDDMAGYKTSSIKKIIGQVATRARRSE